MCRSEFLFRQYAYQLSVFILGVCCLLFSGFSYLKIQFYEICFPLTVLLFVVNLLLFRNRQTILFIDFFIFIYFLYLFYYFYQGKTLSAWKLYQKKWLFERVCFLFYLFYYSQFCIYRKYIRLKNASLTLIRGGKYDFTHIEKSVLLVISFTLLFCTFRIGTDMIRNGFNYSVYIHNLKESSVIPALFVLIFALYAFSKNANKLICYFFCFAYLYFCLSRGFRITAIPAVFVMYLAFYEGKIPNMVFLIFLLLGLFGILVLGELKDAGTVNLKKMLDSSRGGTIISHHADILYTMTATIGLAEQGVIDGLLRIKLGIAFFFQSLILPSFFPDTLRYPLVISFFTRNGGGGFFLAGSYLFWGCAGVFISSYIINLVIVHAYNSRSIYFRLMIAIVFVFSCNWISYDFHTILRFPLYALIAYWLLTHIDWRYLKNEKSASCVYD